MKIAVFVTDNLFIYEIKSLLSAFFIDAEFYDNDHVSMDLFVYVKYEMNKANIKIKNSTDELNMQAQMSGIKYEDVIKIEQKIYEAVNSLYNISLPWGILTGVRPVKIAVKMLQNGKTDEEIISYYRNDRYLSEKKACLCVELAHKEQMLIKTLDKRDRAIYINIPICPQKCNYCSFISKKCKDIQYIKSYIKALIEEINAVSKYFTSCNIISLYIGGGTPGVLNAELIEILFHQINKNFNLSSCREITFEAGRADCINDDMLHALKLNRVDRICINAQSMHEQTLEKIGRNISLDTFYNAYEKISKYDFIKNIDLIYGLEGENEEMFSSSLHNVINLMPENITLHSLSYKKKSDIFKSKSFISPEGFDKSYDLLKKYNYHPYYLYRQKYTANKSENTGFSLPGYDAVYNRLIISERIGIIGLGCGASGKIYDSDTDSIKRVTGYKNIDLYINNTKEAVNKILKVHGFS